MMAALAAPVVIALAVASRAYWGWRLRAWAREQGFTLTHYRGAKSFEGPGRLVRTENQSVFRVEVAAADGARRAGWVTFGSRLGFVLGEPVAGVDWDA